MLHLHLLSCFASNWWIVLFVCLSSTNSMQCYSCCFNPEIELFCLFKFIIYRLSNKTPVIGNWLKTFIWLVSFWFNQVKIFIQYSSHKKIYIKWSNGPKWQFFVGCQIRRWNLNFQSPTSYNFHTLKLTNNLLSQWAISFILGQGLIINNVSTYFLPPSLLYHRPRNILAALVTEQATSRWVLYNYFSVKLKIA